MRSSTSSFERPTAADRPGVAQPVPVRDVPKKPWGAMFVSSLIMTALLLGIWELHARSLALLPGDLGDGPSAWAEQRRRADTETSPVVIVGDSRILFDTNLDRFHALKGIRPIQLALPGTNARPFLEDLADDPRFKGLVIVGIADTSYFREGIGLMRGALDRYLFESPSQRVTFLLDRALSRLFGFIDDHYRLSTLVLRLDRGWWQGAAGPYSDVWKLSTVSLTHSKHSISFTQDKVLRPSVETTTQSGHSSDVGAIIAPNSRSWLNAQSRQAKGTVWLRKRTRSGARRRRATRIFWPRLSL